MKSTRFAKWTVAVLEIVLLVGLVGCKKPEAVTTFKGFKVSPQGHAKIEVRDSVLVVSNIGASGLDGVLIETYPQKSIVVNFEYGTINDKTQLNARYIGRDTLMRIKTLGEFNFSKMAEDHKFGVNVNSRLLPDSVTLTGKMGNEIVYKKQFANPSSNSDRNWVWLVVAAVLYIADNASYSSTTTTNYDANGNKTGSTTSTTYDWGSIVATPVKDNEGVAIVANEFELNARYQFNPQSNNKPNEVCGIVYSAANIDKFIIKDIKVRK